MQSFFLRTTEILIRLRMCGLIGVFVAHTSDGPFSHVSAQILILWVGRLSLQCFAYDTQRHNDVISTFCVYWVSACFPLYVAGSYICICYSGANTETTQLTSNSSSSLSMSPSAMIMSTINYNDLPGSPGEELVVGNSLENSIIGLNSDTQSPSLGAVPITSIPYTLTPLTLDNSPQPTVSPVDPNLNNSSMGSPCLNSQVASTNSPHSNRSSPTSTVVQMTEPFNLAQFPHRLKQEVI